MLMQGGMKARVAEVMAEGDRYTGIGTGTIIAAAPADIGNKLGIAVSYVRSTQARIHRDLGPQALAADLGWRGGKVWHPGRP